MRYINIDFARNDYRIEEFENITLTVPQKKFLLGMIKKEINIIYHSIRFSNLRFSEDLEIKNINQLLLFSISSTGNNSHHISYSDLKITNETIEINIHLDTSQVIDFKDKNQNKTKITFDVIFQDKPDSQEIVKSYEVELVFFKDNTKLDIRFELTNETLMGIEHRKNVQIPLGLVNILTLSDHFYSDTIDWCNVKVFTKQDEFEDDVFFEKDSVRLSSRNIKVDNLAKYEVKLLNFTANENIQLSLFTDLSANDSPLEETNEVVYIDVEYSINGNVFKKSGNFSYKLLPDIRSTALLAQLKSANNFQKISDNKIINSNFQWLGAGQSGKSTCFTFRLGNYAESGNGMVIVKDFNIHFEYNKRTSSVILDEKADLIDGELNYKDYQENLQDIFLINDEKASELPKELKFRNDLKSYKDFVVSFRHNDISSIPDDVASIITTISFSYSEDHENYHPFESKVFFKVERNLGDAWLALDFGTSASVAAFANGEMLEKNHDMVERLLINLQQNLKPHIKNYDNPSTEVSEKGTYFLSSEMVLRQSIGNQYPMIESSKFEEDVVHISPDKGMYEQRRSYMIPYLKSLIGSDHIPDLSGNISKDYKYKDEDNNITNFADKPISVDTVLRNTYNIMVRDFIAQSIPTNDELNKIVLTVPNTFTPKHFNAIRTLIDERFENIKKDYINFISESDAVAVYYMNNWKEFNMFRKNQHAFDDNKDEYILVYDAGAGTTDLTYFRIKKEENFEKTIEIIGKFGKSTAGNYLDYVIANILEELRPPHAQYSYVGSSADIGVTYQIKSVIKDKIKPNLNNSYSFYINPANGNISDSARDGEVEINTDQIIEHPFMQEFLKGNTTELFEKFFTLFNRLSPSDRNILEKGEFPIDTVLFTGRTVQYTTLREQATSELKKWTNRENTYFIKDIDSNKLKSIVVLGALTYAMNYRNPATSLVKIKNRNIYARYGFIYKDVRSGLWAFQELLNPATKPIDATPNIVDGMTIYSYDTDVHNALPKGESPFIDLRGTMTGFFVQSFSQHTARDINENDWQYVTSMFSFSKGQLAAGSDLSKVKTRIEVLPNNDMVVSIGNYINDPQAPLKIDTTGSESFKKGMWPYYTLNN